ncbi:c-type cytochrome [Flavobacterium tegetincola]|uniref:c-type cytochrome n=1 Tax=Flavobacterium tegetincola TaxID=150172 RepID=UPI00047A67FD|nr:c-type cytochrome [Flavobacterium tegetincola]
MKNVGNHNSISRIVLLSLAFMLTFTASSYSQDDAAAGKALFNANCAACHKLDAKMTGPALRNISERHSNDWLKSWVKNSQAMVKSGDAAAVKLFEENNKAIMPSYPQFSDADIDNILAYTSEPLPVATAPEVGAGSQAGASSDSGISNVVILGALALVMGILVIMLFLVSSVLNKIAKANGMEVLAKEKTLPIWKAYAKNQFLVLVTAIFLLLSGAWVVYGFLMQVGVDQDYAPLQPIHYSHKIHAGENGIDCKYCHSSARTSKHSGIPSLNVCMNCHKSVSEFSGDKDSTYVEYTKEFYTAEIQKLYDAVGWDKEKQMYTGKTKPVKWVRIHNLPDHVYFNHSQHVTVGGIECQKCHGPVEGYEIMKQFAPLTMGWCINCHRETNVKMEGNAYYENIHAELAKKYGKDKLTAAEMGGIECGKCHY